MARVDVAGTLRGEKYPAHVLLIPPNPKFHSVSLCNSSFPRYLQFFIFPLNWGQQHFENYPQYYPMMRNLKFWIFFVEVKILKVKKYNFCKWTHRQNVTKKILQLSSVGWGRFANFHSHIGESRYPYIALKSRLHIYGSMLPKNIQCSCYDRLTVGNYFV